jgi:hypothetical protein
MTGQASAGEITHVKRSSWIILAISALLLGLLAFLYVQSQQKPPDMTQSRIESMLDKMKDAVAHKNIRALMSFVDQSSETRISKLNVDQLRLTLSRAFNNSDQLEALYTGLALHNNGDESTAEFDLKVVHHLSAATADDYDGHIVLYLKRLEVPHLLGLYHSREWKIVRADTNGPDLTNYGDY